MVKFAGDAEIDQLSDRIAAIFFALESQDAGPSFLQMGKHRQSIDSAMERVKSLQVSGRNLRDYFKLLRAALESIQEGVLIIEHSGKLVYFNCAAEKLLKIDKEETLDQWLELHEVREVGQKSAMERDRLPFLRVLAGQSVEQDLYVLRKGAAVGTFLKISSLPVMDTSGRVLAAVAIFADISKQILDEQVRQSLTSTQKKVNELTAREGALAEQLNTVGATLESIAEGVAVLNSDGKFVFINESAARLFGVERNVESLDEVFASLDFLNHDRSGNLSRQDVPIVRALAGERILDEEMYVQRKGDAYGIWLKVCAQPIGDSDGQQRKTAFVIYDVTQQKLDEHLLTHLRRLEESGRKSRLALQRAELPFLSINAHGVITEWNDRAEALFGWPSAEAIGASLADLLVPKRSRPAYDRVMQAFATAGEPTSFNRRMQLPAMHRDGRELLVEISIYSIKWEESYELCGFPQDITLRSREENRRSIRYNIARLLGDEVTVDGVLPKILQSICMTSNWEAGIIWHVDGQRLKAKEVWCAPTTVLTNLTGVTLKTTFKKAEGLLGQVWAERKMRWVDDLTKDAGLAEFGDNVRSSLLIPMYSDEGVLGVIQLFNTQKRIKDADLMSLFQEMGHQIGQFIEGKRAIERQKQFSSIIDSANEAVRMRDREIEGLRKKLFEQEGQVTTSSPDTDRAEIEELKARLAAQTEELKNASKSAVEELRKKLATQSDAKQADKLEAEGLRQELAQAEDRRLLDERQVQELKKKLLEQADELKRVYDELEALRKMPAGSKDSAQVIESFFSATLCHEIRAPMNAVIGLSDILVRTTAMTEEQRDFANLIHDSGAVLLGIFDDILEHAKIERGDVALERDEFSMQSVIEETASIVASKAAHKKVSVFTFVAPEVPPLLCGDRKRVLQVITKLVETAVNLTERGGVVLRATLQKTVADKALVRISISDTGTGLASSSARLAYKLVTQSDLRKPAGVDLGMSIAQRLAERLGGEIGMESDVGAGASFWFCAGFEQLDQAPAPLAVPDEIKTARVLVVDGPAGASRVISAYCSGWGLHCDWVLTGEEAISVLEQGVALGQPYDFMLMEKIMFGMNGFALAKAIRERTRLDRTRLILYGPYGEGRDGDVAQAGFSRLIRGPLKQSVLLEQFVSLMHEIRTKQPPSRRPESKARTVLIVEDNPVVQKVILLQLNELGYAAQVVASGLEAIHAALDSNYGLILMDTEMPAMDGLKATAKIREAEQKSGRHIPIIGLSANILEHDRQCCLDAGMDDYLPKPLETESLREVVSRFIPELPAFAAHGWSSFQLAGDPAHKGYYPMLAASDEDSEHKGGNGAPDRAAHLEPVKQFAHLQNLRSLSQSFLDSDLAQGILADPTKEVSARRSHPIMGSRPGASDDRHSSDAHEGDDFQWDLDAFEEPQAPASATPGPAVPEPAENGFNNGEPADLSLPAAEQDWAKPVQEPVTDLAADPEIAKDKGAEEDFVALAEQLLEQLEKAISSRDAAARKKLALEFDKCARWLGDDGIVELSTKLKTLEPNDWKRSKSTLKQLQRALKLRREPAKSKA